MKITRLDQLRDGLLVRATIGEIEIKGEIRIEEGSHYILHNNPDKDGAGPLIGTGPWQYGWMFDQSGLDCEYILIEPLDDPAPSTPRKPAKSLVLPDDAVERKKFPLYSGLLTYFPDALLCVARTSYEGNEQHHPGTPLHWDKSKSQDELDALMRHCIDKDWAKVAWRALANLQRRIDAGEVPGFARNAEQVGEREGGKA